MKDWIDSRLLIVNNNVLIEDSFHSDFLEGYKNALEDIPDDLPMPCGKKLQSNISFDVNLADNCKLVDLSQKLLLQVVGLLLIG